MHIKHTHSILRVLAVTTVGVGMRPARTGQSGRETQEWPAKKNHQTAEGVGRYTNLHHSIGNWYGFGNRGSGKRVAQ